MKVLLTAATTFEIEPTLQLIEKNGFSINNNQIEVLITGIGLVATTHLLTTKLLKNEFDLVIQGGIAGSFNCNNYSTEQVVAVKYDTFGDLGIEEKEQFISIFEAGYAGKNQSPFNDGWLINQHAIIDECKLPQVKSVSINKVSDSKLQINQLQHCFAADIETMEGAAMHYVCIQHNTSFLQIRSISNEVGERDKTKWRTVAAVKNLNTELLKLLLEIL